jgi:ABC-2 type transport system permease protein
MKYFTLFRTYLQNTLVYPVSFWMWRTRQFLATFASIALWAAIFQNQSSAFGYSRDQMMSYIFLVGFMQSMVLATQMHGLAQQIYNGEISNLFVKPLKVFRYILTQELADKVYNLFFVIFETGILIAIFKPQIHFPDLLHFLFFLIATVLGAILYFFIMLLFGSVGFWSPDTWGPRFLFFMFLDFTAGKLYPLDILPKIIQNIIYFTPFPYLSYVQTQIFLGRFSYAEILQFLAIILIWIAVCSSVFKKVWNTGLKEYGALGR